MITAPYRWGQSLNSNSSNVSCDVLMLTQKLERFGHWSRPVGDGHVHSAFETFVELSQQADRRRGWWYCLPPARLVRQAKCESAFGGTWVTESKSYVRMESG